MEMSDYEEQLFTEAVIQKANESVLYEMDCGDIPETGIFHVAICFTFSKRDPYYYEKHFNKALIERMEKRLHKEIDGIAYSKWSVDEDGKELPERKTNDIKRQREEIQKWNTEHKVRVLTMFCTLTPQALQFRVNTTKILREMFLSFIEYVILHPERDTKASDEHFKVIMSMQFFSYKIDKIFNAVYKNKRGNAIPEYARKVIYESCMLHSPIHHLAKITIDSKKIVVETDIYIPNNYKKVKITNNK